MGTADAGIELTAELCRQGYALGAHSLGDELDLDFFLLGNKDDDIALHHCLTAQSPAFFEFCRCQPNPTSMAQIAMFDSYPAATAATLTATRKVEHDAGFNCGVGKQGPNLDFDDFSRRLEDDDRLAVPAVGLFSHSSSVPESRVG